MSTEFSETVKTYRPIEQLIPQDWQHRSFTASDGAQLAFYDTGGQKPAVILLHGFQAAALMWLRTARALEGSYRVLMPDSRGHGYSHASLAGFSLERLTEDVANMIHALGLDRPALVGHSLGAEIAGRVAAEHPNLVGRIVLADPPMRVFQVPPSAGGEPPPWVQQWLANMQALKSQTHEQRLQTALKLMPPGAGLWGEEDLVAYAEACTQLNLDVLQSASFMPYSVVTPAIAGRITAPLLLLTGDPQRGSVAVPKGVEILMNGDLREHITFADAGHFIQIDKFDRFIEIVRDFLEQG